MENLHIAVDIPIWHTHKLINSGSEELILGYCNEEFVSNDYGYDFVFERQIKVVGNEPEIIRCLRY